MPSPPPIGYGTIHGDGVGGTAMATPPLGGVHRHAGVAGQSEEERQASPPGPPGGWLVVPGDRRPVPQRSAMSPGRSFHPAGGRDPQPLPTRTTASGSRPMDAPSELASGALAAPPGCRARRPGDPRREGGGETN